MSQLDAFEALLSMPLDDDCWRDHRLTQEGDPRRMEIVWPQLKDAYAAHRMADKDEQTQGGELVSTAIQNC